MDKLTPVRPVFARSGCPYDGGGHHGKGNGHRHGGELLRSGLVGSTPDGPVLRGSRGTRRTAAHDVTPAGARRLR